MIIRTISNLSQIKILDLQEKFTAYKFYAWTLTYLNWCFERFISAPYG